MNSKEILAKETNKPGDFKKKLTQREDALLLGDISPEILGKKYLFTKMTRKKVTMRKWNMTAIVTNVIL
jgi:hypothetical protein